MTSLPFTCGHCLGVLLLFYGLFNTYLFIKFTPVYTATSCGDQTAVLKKFEVGESIHVGVEIQVLCSNPNPYQVRILHDTPGHVFVGKDRGNVGVLTLLEGSTLPAQGQGTIKVFMDSHITKGSSGSLAQQFLGSGEIPIFMELKFNVGVDISFGLQHFGTTAPFDKKCGMNIGGMFERSANKLGPMLCRSSFDELGDLPHLGEALPGQMSFSAAQMDPERIRAGERLKNICILGAGGFSYLLGFFLTFPLFQNYLRVLSDGGPTLLRASSRTVSREGLNGPKGSGQSSPQHRGLLRGFFSSPGSPERREPKRSQDPTDQRSRLLSLLSCGFMGASSLRNPGTSWGEQPSLARRSDSQASGELSGLSCARLSAYPRV